VHTILLVPIYLGLCRAADLDKGHEAAGALINADLSMAMLVSLVHSVAMVDLGRQPHSGGRSLARGQPFQLTRISVY
jgi:hypothetical protein